MSEQIQKDLGYIIAEMPNEDLLIDLADFFKVIGDSTRIKILYAISKKEICVSDIANVLNMNQSAISHQLRILKASRIVRYKKIGKQVYYALDDDHIKYLFSMGLEHIKEG